MDKFPALGRNYYRLSQTDLDGQSEMLGDLVVIEYSNQGQLSIQPNPVRSNEVNLILVSQKTSDLSIQLYDMNGKVLRNGQYDLIKGRNELRLNVDDLTNGVYLLKALVDGKVQTHRILKAN